MYIKELCGIFENFMENLVRITTFNTKAEAELAAGLLKNHGIASLVSSLDNIPHLSLFTGPSQLLVKKKDAPKARTILAIN